MGSKPTASSSLILDSSFYNPQSTIFILQSSFYNLHSKTGSRISYLASCLLVLVSWFLTRRFSILHSTLFIHHSQFIPHPFSPFLSHHSLRNESTGLDVAALMDWKPITIQATRSTAKAENPKISQPRSILYW